MKIWNDFLKLSWNERIYYFGVFLVIIGLPTSRFLVSISFAFLGLGWVCTPNPMRRIKSFLKNKYAWSLTGIFLLHLIGLLWTEDIHWGMKDINSKLPLFLFPFFFSSMPDMSPNWRKHWVTIFALTCVLSATFVLGRVLAYEWGWLQLSNFRDASPLISHIRLSIMSVFVILLMLFSPQLIQLNKGWKVVSIILIILYLSFMKSATGWVLLLLVGTITALLTRNKQKSKLLPIGVLITVILITIWMFSVFQNAIEYYAVDEKKNVLIDKKEYTHFHKNKSVENGHYIFLNLHLKGMKEAWNKISNIPFDGKTPNGNGVRFTLYRYLCSKDLTKDGRGVEALSKEDVLRIEKGISSAKIDALNPISQRIYAIVYELTEFKNGSTPNGHSLTQRIVYFKTGLDIIRNNGFLGVGTGDVRQAYEQQYVLNNSTLEKRFQLRAHNQFLTFGISLGVFGLLIIVFLLVVPFLNSQNRANTAFVVLMLITMLSLLNEDTLETQIGVTFFALFWSILLIQSRALKLNRDLNM